MEHRITPTVRLIRSAVLSGYVDVAKSVGLEPYGMIARRSLPPALRRPELSLPTFECLSGIHVASGVRHQIRNVSKQPVRFLVISQPASHGDRVVVASANVPQ